MFSCGFRRIPLGMSRSSINNIEERLVRISEPRYKGEISWATSRRVPSLSYSMLSSSSARKNRREYRDSVTGFYMRNRNWKHAEESHKVRESTCDIQSKLLYYLRGVIEERTIRFSGGQPTTGLSRKRAHTHMYRPHTHMCVHMYVRAGRIPASRYS